MSSIEIRIENIINTNIRPYLQEHFGDVRFISYKDDTVRISFEGACKGCPSAATTLEGVVKKSLVQGVPSIKEVIAVNQVSDDLMAMARQILNRPRKEG